MEGKTQNNEYLRFFQDLNSKQPVTHRINDDEDVSEFRRNDIVVVVSIVLRPDYVHFVIPQVAHLNAGENNHNQSFPRWHTRLKIIRFFPTTKTSKFCLSY